MRNVVIAACVLTLCGSSQAMTVENLKCEYLTNPLGLDETNP